MTCSFSPFFFCATKLKFEESKSYWYELPVSAIIQPSRIIVESLETLQNDPIHEDQDTGGGKKILRHE